MSSATASEYTSRLVDLIGKSVDEALLLRTSLEEERRALEAQDLDALHAAAGSKTRSVERLQTLEAERRHTCAASGLGDANGDIAQLAAADSRIAGNWQKLIGIVTECNQLNTTNGAIIRVRKDHVETSLAVIRGSSPETGVYGRDGKGMKDASQQTLAEV